MKYGPDAWAGRPGPAAVSVRGRRESVRRGGPGLATATTRDAGGHKLVTHERRMHFKVTRQGTGYGGMPDRKGVGGRASAGWAASFGRVSYKPARYCVSVPPMR